MKVFIRVGNKQEKTVRCKAKNEVITILNLLDEMEVYGAATLIEVRDESTNKLIRMYERDKNMEWTFY